MPSEIPNRILCADAYTVSSHDLVSPEMRRRAAYHIVFRRFQAPPGLEGFGEGKLVFHGLTGILRKLFGRPLAPDEVAEAREVLGSFHAGGTAYPADWEMWEHIARLGHFPLKIYARRDGSIVNVGEPVVQVVAEPGYGELAAHFESKLLQCWAPSAKATVMRRWLEYNEDLVRRSTDLTDPAQVRFLAQLQTSDFGDRAGSCHEESEVLGLAHLTSHAGTDTLCAAALAWRGSGGRFNGASIRALAHRVVQGWPDEEEAFRVLHEVAGDGGYSSHVADCYDFRRAVTQFLVPLALQAAGRGSVIVVRPDSGEGLEDLLFILDAARKAGLSRTNGRGLLEMSSLRYIYANSLDFRTIRHELNEPLLRAGYAVPMCGLYGIGGFLRNCISRDGIGAAMKLCAVGDELRPVAKFAGRGKASIPGLVEIRRVQDGGATVHPAAPPEAGHGYGELSLMYDCGRWTQDFEEGCDFLQVRRRVQEDWAGFVPSPLVLAEGIREVLDRLEARHVRRQA